jgi:hypothetical protein
MRPPYASVTYAEAFGTGTMDVPEWGTAVLVQAIPDSDWKDARGCYPLAALAEDADLDAGIDRLRSAGLVSVALVPDPLSGPSPEALAAAFEICRPFKTHYLFDRSAPARVSATHRRWVRSALKQCRVDRIDLRDALPKWEALYAGLVEQRRISGIQRFSHSYFAALADMPELIAFAAFKDDRMLAMTLWVEHGGVAYYHLGASTAEGYDGKAMYGIFATAFDSLGQASIFHFGGGAGARADEGGGLARFKRGFANREIPAYFCGARLRPDRYAILAGEQPSTDFFPAYRTR